MQKNIHEITLTGYGAKGRNLNFGTWGSVGLEQLHIIAQSPWDETAVITVTFLNGKVQSEPQVLPADGILDIPGAATSAANKSKGSCKMVFKGLDGNGAVIYSTDLLYTVQSRTSIDGAAYDPGKNAFEQYVQQTNSARDNALAAASNARDSEIAAGGYKDEAKESAAAAAKSAEEAATSAKKAAESEAGAKTSKEAAEVAADRAEQVASNVGYVAFEINDKGHLEMTRTDNVTEIDFRMKDGRLEAIYGDG